MKNPDDIIGNRTATLRLVAHRVPVGVVVCGECYVLSGRGLCDGLITRPQESYQCGVSECDREAWITRWPWPTGGCCAMVKK